MDLSLLIDVSVLYALSLYLFILLVTITSIISRNCLHRPLSHSLRRAFRQLFPPLLVKLCHRSVQLRRYTFFSGKSVIVRALRSKHVVDPWTLQELVFFLSFLGANASCVVVKSAGIPASGLRAGRLALINLIMLYAGPHFSFLADVVGLPLSTFKRIHICSSFNVLILTVFHIFAEIWQHKTFSLSLPSNKFALVGGVSLVLESIFLPILRHYMWYEVSLRLHQVNAMLLALSVFFHIPSNQKIYVYVTASVFGAVCVLQVAQNLRRHRLRSFPAQLSLQKGIPARLLHENGDLDPGHRVVVVLKTTERPVQVEAGQYVNLWMPHVSALSAFQTHPFTVISWSREPQTELKLVINPLNGWTKRLFEMAQETKHAIAMFSGPHGTPVSTDGYKNVLFLAERDGIYSCLPLLQKLLDEHVRGVRSTVKHIRLAYENDTFYPPSDVEDFINACLAMTTSDGFFDIWLYGALAVPKAGVDPLKFDRFKESIGNMPIEHVLDDVTKLENPTLVLSSMSPDYQDELNILLNKRLSRGIHAIKIPR